VIALPIMQPAPRSRTECADGPRPCPHLGCRYHLGDLWGAQPPKDAETCALDVADRGEHGIEDLARLLGAADATLSDIEYSAKRQLEPFARSMGFAPRGEAKASHVRILHALRMHGPLGRSELAQILGLSKIRITTLLTSLKRAGKVEPLASNTWQLTQEN
jgi:DNA-binding transcriptional ArsR family regulator